MEIVGEMCVVVLAHGVISDRELPSHFWGLGGVGGGSGVISIMLAM